MDPSKREKKFRKCVAGNLLGFWISNGVDPRVWFISYVFGVLAGFRALRAGRYLILVGTFIA